MSNLLGALQSAGNALGVYQRALEVIQNNVTNSATPGYAKQSLNLEARPFDIATGLAGGVSAQGLASARDEYAEDEVRRQLQSLGYFNAQTQGSASIETLFNVTGTSGVPASLNELLQSFSAWSAAPGSVDARQSVIAAAGKLADDVRATAVGLANTTVDLRSKIGSTVDAVNQLTATIQQLNVARLQQSDSDPGGDASLHAALEQLSQLVANTTIIQPDGTATVLLNGGTPLVMGQTQYAVTAASDGSIEDWQGIDVTAQVGGGTLGGLLDTTGRMAPATEAALKTFAQSFAKAVNGILAASSIAPDDNTPGAALFRYDPAQGAASFALDPNATAAGLAAVDASGANGSALKLASLASSTDAGGIDGATFGDYFSGIAAAAGRESAAAQQNQQDQSQVVAQTRTLRDQNSGVSLDDQAVMLMQFQRSYQATAKLLTTLNDVVGDVINLIK